MNRLFATGFLALVAATPLGAQVPGVPGVPGPPSIGITFGLKLTTLGIGVEVGKSIAPKLGARVAFNTFGNYKGSVSADGIDYDLSLKLQAFTALLDLYLVGPFRASAGFVINGNKITVTADPTVNVTIGNTQYTASNVGTLTGTIEFARKIAPYLGLGIGGRGRVGFIFELGAMFPGGVDVGYVATTPLTGAAKTAFDAEAERERQNIDADADSALKVWPVVGFGLQIKI